MLKVWKPRTIPTERDGQDGDTAVFTHGGSTYLAVKSMGKWRFTVLMDDVPDLSRHGGLQTSIERADDVSGYVLKGKIPVFDRSGNFIGYVIVYGA